MIRAVILTMSVVMAFSANCPTGGRTNATQACDCNTEDASMRPTETCLIGQYCIISGNNAKCVDSPLCPSPGSGTDPLIEECYCQTMAKVVATSNPTACTKTSYCDSKLTCRDMPRCQDSDEILLEDCVYGTEDSVCDAGGEFSNGGCTKAPAVCTDDSNPEENCAIGYPCTNLTSCEDEFGVPNGCGAMPDIYEGNNTCGEGFACIQSGEKRGQCDCPSVVNEFDPADKCRCDCDLYRRQWLNTCSSDGNQEKYKEAYNVCNCNCN